MVRNQKEIRREFEHWKKNVAAVPGLLEQLEDLESNEKKITDAFYKNLEFGTGGLRGIMGLGTNRMNIYTVSRASRGVAAYIKKYFAKERQSVSISYDSRINSELFSRTAAEVFASEGIRVYIYPTLMPTPMLSWAVRELDCSAGIMITASHNPAEYNGYKVYGSDGCQITTDIARGILEEIETSYFFGKSVNLKFEDGLKKGIITYIKNDVIDSYMEAVKQQSLLLKGNAGDRYKELSIVYTPLNGTGLKPVVHVLKESGFKNVFVVPEQKMPDGQFATCPEPNPEESKALELGIQYARKFSADIVIATDPDCDRVGIAVPDGNNSYIKLSGNETGVLLLDFICKRRIEDGTMPKNPVFMKSVVTTDLAERIADRYGVRTINLLTGFKYIGEQIGILERNECENDFIFGFEESYGYLSGGYVRDKDGVGAAFLICEMVAYYKKRGRTLLEVLEGIYQEYGYYLNTLHTYKFEGVEGVGRIESIMRNVRDFSTTITVNFKEVANYKDLREMKDSKFSLMQDYLIQCSGEKTRELKASIKIPKTNMIKFRFEERCSIIVRPSGTEPKLKVYICVGAIDHNEACAIETKIIDIFEKKFMRIIC